MEEAPQSLRQKHSNQSEEGEAESRTDDQCHRPAHYSLRHSGGAEVQALEVSTRERTRVGCMEVAWGAPREWCPITEALWEEAWDHHRSKAPFLGRVRGEGAGPPQEHSSLCTQTLRQQGASFMGYGGRCKPLQPTLTPEVGRVRQH